MLSPDPGGRRYRAVARWERDGEDVVVLVPRVARGRLAGRVERWLRPRPPRLRLDAIGTFVWTRLDGRRTVADIAAELQEAFGARVEPAGERLEVFLGQLERGRLIRGDPAPRAT
ncbi:MAG: PqqD family protein [Acidobacteriota bacterium]|jgi:hypothetical protein